MIFKNIKFNYRVILKNFILTLIGIILTSCGQEPCIAPDDFGFIKLTIPATYENEDYDDSDIEYQFIKWTNGGNEDLILNGDPIVVLVRPWSIDSEENNTSNNKASLVSAWCPWLGKGKNRGELSEVCSKLTECVYENNNYCNKPKIKNIPCIMTKGIGLYGLITTEDPNKDIFNNNKKLGVNFHIGNGELDYNIDFRGNYIKNAMLRTYKLSKQMSNEYLEKPRKLYFKIFDSYYSNNSGQYQIVIKSGVKNTGTTDPLIYITELVEKKIFGYSFTEDVSRDSKGNVMHQEEGIIIKMFKSIVSNNNYKLFVNSILTIYIIFSGISFAIGTSKMELKELLTRSIKIIIVSQLLTADLAWKFFHENLFFLFIEGLYSLKKIILIDGAGDSSMSLLSLMMAPETLKKLSSLLFVSWMGWIYFILYNALLFFVFLVFCKSTIIILSAELAIAMIIIMGPIFICFILFDFVESLFNQWLSQLIGLTLQPLLLMAGLALISVIIRHEIYSTLGFGVCKVSIFNNGNQNSSLVGTSFMDNMFSWWIPMPRKTENFIKEKSIILLPESTSSCKPYECKGERYPDLPFLNPNPDSQNHDKKTKDMHKIESFHRGNFVDLNNLYVLFILIYLLHKFNDYAILMSGSITGAGMNFSLNDTYNKSLTNTWNDYKKIAPGLIVSNFGKFVYGQTEGVRRKLYTVYTNWSSRKDTPDSLRSATTLSSKVIKLGVLATVPGVLPIYLGYAGYKLAYRISSKNTKRKLDNLSSNIRERLNLDHYMSYSSNMKERLSLDYYMDHSLNLAYKGVHYSLNKYQENLHLGLIGAGLNVIYHGYRDGKDYLKKDKLRYRLWKNLIMNDNQVEKFSIKSKNNIKSLIDKEIDRKFKHQVLNDKKIDNEINHTRKEIEDLKLKQNFIERKIKKASSTDVQTLTNLELLKSQYEKNINNKREEMILKQTSRAKRRLNSELENEIKTTLKKELQKQEYQRDILDRDIRDNNRDIRDNNRYIRNNEIKNEKFETKKNNLNSKIIQAEENIRIITDKIDTIEEKQRSDTGIGDLEFSELDKLYDQKRKHEQLKSNLDEKINDFNNDEKEKINQEKSRLNKLKYVYKEAKKYQNQKEKNYKEIEELDSKISDLEFKIQKTKDENYINNLKIEKNNQLSKKNEIIQENEQIRNEEIIIKENIKAHKDIMREKENIQIHNYIIKEKMINDNESIAEHEKEIDNIKSNIVNLESKIHEKYNQESIEDDDDNNNNNLERLNQWWKWWGMQ